MNMKKYVVVFADGRVEIKTTRYGCGYIQHTYRPVWFRYLG